MSGQENVDISNVRYEVISILTCKTENGPSLEKIIGLARLTSSLEVTNEVLELIEKYIGGKHEDVDENALILLDFLVKHGDFLFPQSCRENEALLQKLRDLKEKKAHSNHSLRITWILGVLANSGRLQMARIRAQTDMSRKNGENLLKPFWHNLQPPVKVPNNGTPRPPATDMNGFLEMILNMQNKVDEHFENEEKEKKRREEAEAEAAQQYPVVRENPFLRDQEQESEVEPILNQSDMIAADLEQLFLEYELDSLPGTSSSSRPSTSSSSSS